jgi:hypothetical protein
VNHMGLNQLLCAAVVNNQFRETLLRDPGKAIATGYLDHNFTLTPEERDLVIDIKAAKFEDFAAQVYDWVSGNGGGYGLNGNGRRLQAHMAAGA